MGSVCCPTDAGKGAGKGAGKDAGYVSIDLREEPRLNKEQK